MKRKDVRISPAARNAIREQVAGIMVRAEIKAGGREGLALKLGVDAKELGSWIDSLADAPVATVNNAVRFIMGDALEAPKTHPKKRAAGTARRKRA